MELFCFVPPRLSVGKETHCFFQEQVEPAAVYPRSDARNSDYPTIPAGCGAGRMQHKEGPVLAHPVLAVTCLARPTPHVFASRSQLPYNLAMWAICRMRWKAALVLLPVVCTCRAQDPSALLHEPAVKA